MQEKTIQLVSKAIEETSKTTGKVLDIVIGVGKHLEPAGKIVEDLIGIGSDSLYIYRRERMNSLEEKAGKTLRERGIKDTIPIPPKIALPLIEAATLEDNDYLHTKWANMLSNAMDPNYKNKITRNFISILEDMNPIDVLILDTICKIWLLLPKDEQNNTLFDQSKIIIALGINEKECELSFRNLIRLGCIKPGVIIGENTSAIEANIANSNAPQIYRTVFSQLNKSIPTYKDTELVGLTELGLEFYKATSI